MTNTSDVIGIPLFFDSRDAWSVKVQSRILPRRVICEGAEPDFVGGIRSDEHQGFLRQEEFFRQTKKRLSSSAGRTYFLYASECQRPWALMRTSDQLTDSAHVAPPCRNEFGVI